MKRETVRLALVASLPVMAGYLVLGFGFGVLLSAKGYSATWALLMCVTIYAGSMQYVGVTLLASGASLLSTALMTLTVNARHIFYGISMIERYRDMGWRKPYAIFGLTDETYSLVCAEPPPMPESDRRDYFFAVTLFNQCYWIIGGCLGALLGSAVTLPSKGIDFSMTALFVTIFIEQWEKSERHFPAALGVLASLVCLLIFGAERFLIPAMLSIAAGLFLLRGRMEGGERA